MKKNQYFVTTLAIATLFLVSCTTVTPYFPDKQKDYRYSREIADLRLPSDLSEHRIKELSIDPDLPIKIKEQKTTEAVEQTEEARQSQIGEQKAHVQLAGFNGGALRLIVAESFKRTWYIVGKALSRQSIEVTERNQSGGSFTIQFDPTKREVEEGTLWDEFEFFFGEEQHQDQKFHILLADNGQKTEVVVTDEKGLPQSKGSGLGVLVVLFESIKEDLVGSQ
jgi:outer membrane protein assembly factor BamC